MSQSTHLQTGEKDANDLFPDFPPATTHMDSGRHKSLTCRQKAHRNHSAGHKFMRISMASPKRCVGVAKVESGRLIGVRGESSTGPPKHFIYFLHFLFVFYCFYCRLIYFVCFARFSCFLRLGSESKQNKRQRSVSDCRKWNCVWSIISMEIMQEVYTLDTGMVINGNSTAGFDWEGRDKELVSNLIIPNSV